MSKFADYLKAQGATAEEIAVLDTPVAQKAYEAMEARVADVTAKSEDYQKRVDKYYEDWKADAAKRDRDITLARAEAARNKAALLSLQQQGLTDVAKDLGFDPESAPKVEQPGPKYVTEADIMPALNQAGDGLAGMVDIMAEHQRLFPTIPFSARAIRNEQIRTGKSFEQFWMDKYGVPAAREAFAKKEKEEYENRLRKEGEDAARAKFASEYGNPATRPPSPSNSPFVIRKTDDGQVRQPWGRTEDQNSDARVRRATENLIKRGESATH